MQKRRCSMLTVIFYLLHGDDALARPVVWRGDGASTVLGSDLCRAKIYSSYSI